MFGKLAVILCVCLAHRAVTVPMKKRTAELPSDDYHTPVAQTPGDPFDAGLVGACVIPNTSFCAINYTVPSNIARIAMILDQEVQTLYDTSDGSPCGAVEREDRCAQKFPRCDAGGVTLISARDCQNRLEEACGSTEAMQLIQHGNCRSEPEETHSPADCKPFAEHDLQGFEFQHCNISSDAIITTWMLEIIKIRDLELTALFTSDGLSMHQSCHEDHARHACQLPGECDADGVRFVVVNTNQQCSAARDCYPDNKVDLFLGSLLSCMDWPNELVGAVSPTVYHSDPTTRPASTPPTSSVTPPAPGVMTLAPLSDTSSAQTLHPTLLVLLAQVLLFRLLQ